MTILPSHGRPSSVAALVGNGLSIATNPGLLIPNITREIVDRLDAAGDLGDQPAQLMQEIARRVRIDDSDSNFEQLVAPFDEFSNSARMLTKLADAAGAAGLDVVDHLIKSSEFALDVRKHAVSHILEVISERSIAHLHTRIQLERFTEELINSAHGGEVTFGNLNYDSLLMAVLSELYSYRLCDLTDGRYGLEAPNVVDGAYTAGRRLRRIGDLPTNRNINLLHLHGSLSWVRDPDTGLIYRLGIDDLRNAGYWAAWREGRTLWEPVVVLTNQSTKTSLIGKYPFKLAYDLFYSRLLTADRWLIAGSSLGDECVNEMLQRAWRTRSTTPQVLVVTKGAWPSERQVLDAVGYDLPFFGDPDPASWLQIERDGIADVQNSFGWWVWADVAKPIARAS